MFLQSFLSILFLAQPSISLNYPFEESISDLLVKCNAYQFHVYLINRTVHPCEKKDPDDFRYFITPMTTQYTKRSFLCVLFFKTDYTQLDFKFLFSHSQFEIIAVLNITKSIRES